jgi:hypothetical protein
MFARYGMRTGASIGGSPFSNEDALTSTVPQTSALPVASLNSWGTYNPGPRGSLPAEAMGPVHGELMLGQQDENDFSDPIVTSINVNLRLQDVGHNDFSDAVITKRHFQSGQLVMSLGTSATAANEPDTVRSRIKRYKKSSGHEAYPTLFKDITNTDKINAKRYDSRALYPLAGETDMYVQNDDHSAHFPVAVKNVCEIRVFPFTGVEALLKRLGHDDLWGTISTMKPYGFPVAPSEFSKYEPGLQGDALSVFPVLETVGAGTAPFIIHYIPVLNLTAAQRVAIRADLVGGDVNSAGGAERQLATILNKIFRIGKLFVSHSIVDDHWVVSVNTHTYA